MLVRVEVPELATELLLVTEDKNPSLCSYLGPYSNVSRTQLLGTATLFLKQLPYLTDINPFKHNRSKPIA